MPITNMLQNAIKAKSPILGIPIPGERPFCVRRELFVDSLRGLRLIDAAIQMPLDGDRCKMRLEVWAVSDTVKAHRKFVPLNPETHWQTQSTLREWAERQRKKVSGPKLTPIVTFASRAMNLGCETNSRNGNARNLLAVGFNLKRDCAGMESCPRFNSTKFSEIADSCSFASGRNSSGMIACAAMGRYSATLTTFGSTADCNTNPSFSPLTPRNGSSREHPSTRIGVSICPRIKRSRLKSTRYSNYPNGRSANDAEPYRRPVAA